MPAKRERSELSTRIQDARKKARLSQAEAGKVWGISKRTLESWEHGYRKPRGLALAALDSILQKIEES